MSLLRATVAGVHVSVIVEPVAPRTYTVLLNSYDDGPANYHARGRSAESVLSRVAAYVSSDDASARWPFVD